MKAIGDTAAWSDSEELLVTSEDEISVTDGGYSTTEDETSEDEDETSEDGSAVSEEDTFEPPSTLLQEIPVEVWENVIDQLQDDMYTLLACTRVCRAWTPRSRLHLRKWIVFYKRRQVPRLAKLVRTGEWEVKSCRRVEIVSSSLRTLGLFAAMFAGKMPHLETLVVKSVILKQAKWNPGKMYVDVFLYLSAFTSITRLALDGITFPNAQVFGRLICALPSLTDLQCRYLEFEAHGFRLGVLLPRPRKLASLDLYIDDLPTMDDVNNLMVGTKIASTLKEIVFRWELPLHALDESGISALVFLAGASLRSLDLRLTGDPLPAGESAPVIDFSKLNNLERVRFTINAKWFDDEGIPARMMPWLCDRLSAIPKSSTALRELTLNLILDSEYVNSLPPEDAVHHGFDSHHCQLLDDTLSTPSCRGLKQFILVIQTYTMNATNRVEQFRQLAPMRFPKLAARGILRVVIDDLDDYHIHA